MLRLQTFKLEIAYSKGIIEIHNADPFAKLISLQPIRMKKSRKTRGMSVTWGHQPKRKPSTWIWQSLDLPIRQVTLSEIKAAKAKTDAVLESLAAVSKHGWLENLAAVPLSQPPSNFREDLSIQKGFVFKSWRIEVPLSLRQCVIDKTHASHVGV